MNNNFSEYDSDIATGTFCMDGESFDVTGINFSTFERIDRLIDRAFGVGIVQGTQYMLDRAKEAKLEALSIKRKKDIR